MEFVDRKHELLRLKKVTSYRTSTLSIIYGRRRIGKSRLIKEVLEENDIYFMADQSETSRQIELFSKQINLLISGFDKVVYPNWEILFENLNYRIKKDTVICIDEFPYLVKNAPELPSILQKIWENKETLNYHLILCGSSQQLMHGLVMNAAAPLYGRADEIIKIGAISVFYLQKILGGDAVEAITEYSIWGGIPRYWELRNRETNLMNALNYHVLTSQGILYNEPVHLFLDDMRDTVHSFTLLSLIASGSNRLSEIATRIEKPASQLSGPLNKLIQLGYIEREIPYGDNEKNSKKSLYKISDPFLDFYFKFVVPNRSLIEIEQTNVVSQMILEKLPYYVSAHWEKICRSAIPFLKINGIQFKPASRWWSKPKKDTEIELDIVAESVDRKYLLVGECKWNEKAINEKEQLNKLMKKAELLAYAKGREIIPALFLKTQQQSSTENIFSPQDIINVFD